MGVNCHEFVVIKLRVSNFSIFGTKIEKIGGDKGNVLQTVGFFLLARTKYLACMMSGRIYL